jgi:phosphoglycolate phosphatase-like HAD superfamily hydrolase
MDYQSQLKEFKPDHDFFIGVDSDGCVFDTMEAKQKEFFIPNALKYFNLFPISKILRETWEFVNLYSVNRGGNRYLSIIKVFDLLSERVETGNPAYSLPDLTSLKEWVKNETNLGTESLKKYYESHNDPSLANVIRWTEAVNSDIREWLPKMPPFPNALRAIQMISTKADMAIVSQTPLEAISREWEENNMIRYVRLIAGQEQGTKTQQIETAAKGKYPENKILMIGDAIGDLTAARENNILFLPIVPGMEDNSWKRFIDEGFERFITGRFAGTYEDSLQKEFIKSLPDNPPWQR